LPACRCFFFGFSVSGNGARRLINRVFAGKPLRKSRVFVIFRRAVTRSFRRKSQSRPVFIPASRPALCRLSMDAFAFRGKIAIWPNVCAPLFHAQKLAGFIGKRHRPALRFAIFPRFCLAEGRPGIVRNPRKNRLADCSKTEIRG